ncbi:MAG TPA: outer membrane beta-barrel protein [Vicinamibacterales bacterium]|jgi:hypothetical protein
MRKILFFAALALTTVAWSAAAQETAGAGRIEISAIPGGAIVFGNSSTGTEPNFGNYTVAGAFGWNFNRWFGVEGEVGGAVGVKQSIDFNGETLPSQHTPNLFTYSGNAVFNPIGNDRPFVPYVIGGIGGMRMLQTDEVANLGVTAPVNYLTGNVGGGLKWFANRHWGARGDYRLMVVNDNANAPGFFGREEVRYGHRIYGGLLFTY